MKIIVLALKNINSDLNSLSSIYTCLLQDGEIGLLQTWNIKPHPSKAIIANQDSQEFLGIYQELLEKLSDNMLIAYNAPYVAETLNNFCRLYGLETIPFYYCDISLIVRAVFPQLPNHRLETVLDYLKLEDVNDNPAYATVLLVLRMMELLGITEPFDLLKHFRLSWKEN